ncbi:hypothetical protein V3589_02525 [Sinorhizobium fredii]|uniref:hypothetical protein n=1 Tax=Rhizobium fredii TaxID=380 RepID=UPI0030B776E6
MGHSPSAVWSYTPRQIAGFRSFAASRLKREQARELSTGFNAARGKPQDVKQQLKDLQKE